MSECSIDDCARAAIARGWCGTHWRRWRRNGDPLALQSQEQRPCAAEGCDQDSRSRGLCGKHYQRLVNNGSLVVRAERSPAQRLADQTDRRGADECWTWTGSVNAKGYGLLWMPGGVRVYAHRLAYELAVGPIADDLTIDHLCRRTGCVNPAHLEVVTRSENSRRQMAAATRSIH